MYLKLILYICFKTYFVHHPQNFMYVVVNPVRRDATVWYHAWCG